ncbi:MAG: hypothetical protein DCC75_06935 [Proteobacteria bacterium]|nr:MAG: hypothetical protein DCC75_06935 [Pseudomonadota bacterium]
MADLSRRRFVKLCSAGTCGAAIHRMFPLAGGMLAFASPERASAMGPNPIMVVVNFAGGASYNVAPIYGGYYRDRNPNVSFSDTDSDALPLSSEQGLHPSLTYFKQIWDEGHLALLNLVGYPNPNRSHAESADIWFQGLRNASVANGGGWGARLTCQIANTFGGISVAGQNTLVQGDCGLQPGYLPRPLGNLTNFGEDSFDSDWGVGSYSRHLRLVRDDMVFKSTFASNQSSSYVRNSMVGLSESLARIAAELNPQTNPLPPGVTFPNNGFGNQCRDAARLIGAAGLGIRFIFLEIGGFDTHSDERPNLTNLMNNVNAGLQGLIQTAKIRGLWDRLIIMTMSEFCRTHENDSEGTDHGHGGPMYVMGGAVVGGIKSPTPTAAETVGDFYRNHHIHFCEPFYQAVQAMGLNADLVFPEPFSRRNFTLFG